MSSKFSRVGRSVPIPAYNPSSSATYVEREFAERDRDALVRLGVSTKIIQVGHYWKLMFKFEQEHKEGE